MALSQYKGTASSASKDIHTVRIPFINNFQQRVPYDQDKDTRFLNCYFDIQKSAITGETKYFLNKRPGLEYYRKPTGATGESRGIIAWLPNTSYLPAYNYADLYYVIGTQIYKNNTNLGVTLTTSSRKCGMTFTRPGATNQYLAINDGIKLYLIAMTTGVVTTITTNFPSPNTGDLVYKDGYFFTLKYDGTLWNCNVDDPTTWEPAKFITAQMANGRGIGLAVQTNILFVLSDFSIQAFYDNANATGSPMQNMESAMQKIGCASQQSIAYDEGQVTWVSYTGTGGYSVYTLNGATNIEEIGTPTINRLIEKFAENAGASYIYGNFIRIAGRKYYILSMYFFNSGDPNQRAFLYDFDLKLWIEWKSSINTDGTSAGNWYFSTCFTQAGNHLYMMSHKDATVYYLNYSRYYDLGFGVQSDIDFLARFGRTDFDTSNRKFVRRLELIGDYQNHSFSTDCYNLQYSDDDYRTWSTIRVLPTGQPRNFAYNLGSFRRRAWQISSITQTPIRLEALELKIRIGDD